MVALTSLAVAIGGGAVALQLADSPAAERADAPLISTAPSLPPTPPATAGIDTVRQPSRGLDHEAGQPAPRDESDIMKLRPRPKVIERAVPEFFPLKPFSITVGSFNVLGSQHSRPGGDKAGYPDASWRSGQAAAAMAKHGVDIVGTQEIQDDQLRQIQSATGMAAYPGLAWGALETDNSILYDPNQFEFVSGDSFSITFMGRSRPQPILRLHHKETGAEFYVVNTHPSAGGGRYAAERAAGRATLVSIVRGLRETGLPVLVTGDMNDREAFYCAGVLPAGMSAPNGGSGSGGCRPPPSPLPVDWVVGAGVSWSNYWRDTSTVERKVSDHFFISAVATFPTTP